MSGKSKKRKSLVLLIASTFWIGYVALTCWQYFNSASRAAEILLNGRKSSLDYVVDTASPALVNDNLNLLQEEMRHARELYLIDFYILQKDGEVLTFYNGNAGADSLNLKYTRFNTLIDTGKAAFRSIKVFDYILTVGIVTNKQGVMMNIFKLDYPLLLKDIATVTSLLVALLFLYLKDILHLSKILTQRDRTGLRALSSLSREGSTLVSAVMGFEQNQQSLQSENRHFSESLTPAILHEIRSGMKAPYQFESVLMRVDLNGYTQIFLQKKDEYVSGILNTYFARARDVIERYGGLIYQYVGDEIVFHIKGSPRQVNAMALSCLRSLFEVAENVEKNLPPEAGHYFKIKACLAPGMMRFVQLDTGYGLSGLPLIETARLLTQIEDKSKNSLCFYSQCHEDFSFLCDIEERRTALLKGFHDQTEIARTSVFKSVDHFLQRGEFKNLRFFRSDQDLVRICRHFAKSLSMENESDLFMVYSFLKDVRLKSAPGELVEAVSSLFQVSLQRNREKWLSDKALATVIALVGPLVPPHQVNQDILDLLDQALDHADHRTCANAILALGDLAKDPSFLREYIHSANNRVSADALLVAGKQGVDRELADKIDSHIYSKNPLFQASGLYVARELVAYFEEKDPVYFETNEFLQRLRRHQAPAKKGAA